MTIFHSHRIRKASLLLALVLTTSQVSTGPANAGNFVVVTPPASGSSGTGAAVGVAGTIIGIAGILGLYDLLRRTTCSGDFLGLGGPGFNQPVQPTQNVIIPPANCIVPGVTTNNGHSH